MKNKLLLVPAAALLALLLVRWSIPTATPPADAGYYTMSDYGKVLKYDVHTHINTFKTYFIEQAIRENFRLLSLNVYVPDYPAVEQQKEYARAHLKEYPGRFAFVTALSEKDWAKDNWQQETLAYLKESFDQGAIGVKVWKNVGMDLRDKDGKFVMIDNPRFDPIIDFIQKSNKTLVGHLGEPKNCWLPLDQMTVQNDKNYFAGHPQYHMYLHPEFPSYQNQIDARDHMLEKHAGLRFDGAHLASLEWSVDELAKRLDKFPHMAVDMAERISHLQYQTQKDHQKVYNFFIKYQDRLMYATDMEVDDSMDSVTVMKNTHDTRLSHWRFFTSDDSIEVPEVKGTLKCLHLPKEVVDKIYRKNAEKWFPGFAKK